VTSPPDPRVWLALTLVAACGPTNPCTASRMRLVRRAATPYAGRWRVTRGDTLTLPQMGDRFRLAEIRLDTARVVVRATCRFRGAIAFAAPRAETLAGAVVTGDSLRGALLLDSRLGIEVKPGVTAQFVAGRVPLQ